MGYAPTIPRQVLSGGAGGDYDGLSLGSGKPPNAKPKERTSIFDIPQDGAELLQDGEATLQAVAAFWTRLRTEGWDALCGARVLGPVGSVFPRFGEVLSEHGVDPGRVQGAWVVPPFILKDLNGPALRWHEVRGRMGRSSRTSSGAASTPRCGRGRRWRGRRWG